MNNTVKIATGFLTGALLGVSLGLLFAPDSGNRTRTKISDGTRRIVDSANEEFDNTKKRLGFGKNKTKRKKHSVKS